VVGNFVCGNFTLAGGAGIAHFGLSENGLVSENTVLFNENFNQGRTVNGGGILIAGQPPLFPATLSPGSGTVQVLRNLIQGNSAGAGDGAGIRLSRINGQDVEVSKKGNVSVDYEIDIINNMIVDNVAALAGGGISLQDVLAIRILHNTIANNDNASTASEAFPADSPDQSDPQPGAGIVSRAHSAELSAILPEGYVGFSDATLVDNIIWQNRMFFFLSDVSDPNNVLNGLCPDINGDVGLDCGTAAVYDDLAVIGASATGKLISQSGIITGGADPQFVAEYVNGNRESTIALPEATTAIQAPPAFDEGGNFIRLRYGPLSQSCVDADTNGFCDNSAPVGPNTGKWILRGDYHIQAGSPAKDIGIDAGIADDFDGEPRPNNDFFDIGADEIQQ
jgi:hypothetical protein